jgi:hypothetical protein
MSNQVPLMRSDLAIEEGDIVLPHSLTDQGGFGSGSSRICLAEAHAKMRLSDTVVASDIHEAVRLIKSALK